MVEGCRSYVRSASESPNTSMAALLGSSSSKKLQSWLRERESSSPEEQRARREKPCPDLDHLTKRPEDSFLRMELPFGRDHALRAQFVNMVGFLRVGKLLEEMDAFAGNIAYLHCSDGGDDAATQPPTLVTVSLDRVDVLSFPLPADVDVEMRGSVSWVGSSSLVIDVELSSAPLAASPGSAGAAAAATSFLTATFTFVARREPREGVTSFAVRVPRLAVQSAAEAARFERARAGVAERALSRASSVVHAMPPRPHELAMLHDLYRELKEGNEGGAGAGGGSSSGGGSRPPAPRLYMEETRLSSVHIAHPTEKNIHGKMFGGSIMRHAHEMAWATAWECTGLFPRFIALDDITFLHPIEVGSIIHFDSKVDYTTEEERPAVGASPAHKRHLYVVSVRAHVRAPAAANKEGGLPGGGSPSSETQLKTRLGRLGAPLLTNTFHFTFAFDEEGGGGGDHATASIPPRVFPRTFEDAMQYVEAARRYNVGVARLAKKLEEREKSGDIHKRT